MTDVCITIDTEGDSADNSHSTYFGIEIIVPLLLDLFAKYDIKATFFVQEDRVCQVGTKFSNLWKSLENEGHEIGYHTHGLIGLPLEEKQNIITNGINQLRNLGIHPISFRAGRYHFDSSYIKILEKNNIKFDSSVIPGQRECFDDGRVISDHVRAPHVPYFPSYENHCIKGDSKILELPLNRYPKLKPHNWGGLIKVGWRGEEVLFDYFLDARKDKLIVINFHSWTGLSSIAIRFVRKQNYGRIKKILKESMRKLISSKQLINREHFRNFDDLLDYIKNKDDIRFVTIQEAGRKILEQK